MKTIDATTAARLLQQGVPLIDIRDPREHAEQRIEGARNVPVSAVAHDAALAACSGMVMFHCLGGKRTALNAALLKRCTKGEVLLLDGGLEGWKKSGLPVVKGTRAPIGLDRQVQILAGALVALGAVLGAVWNPWFHLLSGAVGCGLVFAGISGFCGMARLLMRMPWNRAGTPG